MTITVLENPEDTYISDRGAYEGYNYGIDNEVRAGGDWAGVAQRGLIKFDLSSLPVGATINSAILSLYFYAQEEGPDAWVRFHRGLVQWYEGTKDGEAPGATDGSTWLERNANTGAPLSWVGGAGGGGGDDYVAAYTAEVTITTVGLRFEFDLTADVAGMMAETYDNHGWFVRGEEDASKSGKYFYSKDASDPDQLPKLTVDHEGGGDPPEPDIPAGVTDCCGPMDERGP